MLTLPAFSQMPRERVRKDRPVDATFKASKIILMPSVKNYDEKTLNFAIMHSFGEIQTGYSELFGLDGAANIRFSLDYGLSEKLSVGVGRSRYFKNYDFRAKYNILEQMRSDKVPVSVAYQVDMGINTLERAYASPYVLADRFNYSHVLMIARKFSDKLSLQLMPTLIHFNRVGPDAPNTMFAMGFGGRYKLTSRAAFTYEYAGILGDRPERTKDLISLGIDLETGGHVFQLFFTTATGLTEQFAIAQNSTAFFDTNPFGQFRWGFNVNRIFVGKKASPYK